MSNGNQYIPIGDLDKRIAEIEELMRTLPIELAALERLRGGAVLVESPRDRTEIGEQSVMVMNRGALGPKDAVVAYLRRNPRRKQREVVSMLEILVKTEAVDRKRLLTSTIYNLVKNGSLQEDDDGLLTVSANGKASKK